MLVLGPHAGDPRRRLGGLSLALRLALDAQRAGARAVVCTKDSGVTRADLADARLTLPVLDAAPDDARKVTASASIVAHRATMAACAAATSDVTLVPGAAPPEGTPFGFPTIDVVDDESARRTEKALFRSLRKPQDGWTARWLNRYVSLTLSRLLVKTDLTPNQVSVGILAIGLYGAYLAAMGSYWSMLAGAFLFQMQSILDGCDGEIDRKSVV